MGDERDFRKGSASWARILPESSGRPVRKGSAPIRYSQGARAMSEPGAAVRVASVGDLHCTKLSTGQFRELFAAAAAAADILVLCGDLTDYGLPEEAEVLIREMAAGPK